VRPAVFSRALKVSGNLPSVCSVAIRESAGYSEPMGFLNRNEMHERAVSEISDEQILADSLASPALFTIILKRYEAAFLRRAQEILGGDREEAEDVVQETFSKIYRYAHRFEKQEGASFKSWAYKVLTNTALTAYQKRKKRLGRVSSFTPELEAVLPDAGAEAAFVDAELGDYVGSVLEKMSGSFRHVLERYFLDGWSQREIADEEGVSVGAVKTRMHRAKKEFQTVYASVVTKL
jgi:RNA polymerase sigma-70 factor, ECF subfamily